MPAPKLLLAQESGPPLVIGTLLLTSKPQELLAEVAATAYRVTLQHVKGAFIDVELDLWYALQSRLRRSPITNPAGSAGHRR
jgi:hypothetical protein